MLPIVFSIGAGGPSTIPVDEQQRLEMLRSLAQSLVGMAFLLNMELVWWEAGALFALWGIQFVFSPIPPGQGALGFIATHIHAWVTYAYLVWAAVEIIRMFSRGRTPDALRLFAGVWRTHVRSGPVAPVR
mgnify:CR=1 FL=1